MRESENGYTDQKWGVWGVDFPPGKNRRVTTGSTVCIFSMPSTNGNGQLSIPRVSRNVLIKRTILAWKLPSFENVYAVVLLDLLLSRGLFLREWVAAWQRGSVVEWSLISALYTKSGDLATCWICSLSSRVQIFGHACKIIAYWLPHASWGFKSCYVVFELFVSKYLSGVPVS